MFSNEFRERFSLIKALSCSWICSSRAQIEPMLASPLNLFSYSIRSHTMDGSTYTECDSLLQSFDAGCLLCARTGRGIAA